MANPSPSEKSYLSLWIVDFDYISVRHLMAGYILSSAASLANITIDRYIKTYLWSIGRNDLVETIRKWGGNESHNILRIIDFCKKELQLPLELSDEERKILDNLYKVYCFRYIDYMFKNGGMAEIGMPYMYTIDKMCHFFRSKIVLQPPHLGQTMIDLLIEGKPQSLAALNHGNINLREVLLNDNRYFNPQ